MQPLGALPIEIGCAFLFAACPERPPIQKAGGSPQVCEPGCCRMINPDTNSNRDTMAPAEATPADSPGARLRSAWAQEPIAIPGVFNALVARMADRLGFQAIYLSGGALSATAGVPDVGLLSVNDFVDQAR